MRTLSRAAVRALTALTVALSLSACAGQAEGAGSNDQALTKMAAPEPAEADGWQLGVHACVHNNSTRSINVEWKWSDTNDGDGVIPPAGLRCAEGTGGGAHADVSLAITQGDRMTYYSISNQAIGLPYVSLASRYDVYCTPADLTPEDAETMVRKDRCSPYFHEGDAKTSLIDSPWPFVHTIARLPDNGWKQFEISVKR